MALKPDGFKQRSGVDQPAPPVQLSGLLLLEHIGQDPIGTLLCIEVVTCGILKDLVDL